MDAGVRPPPSRQRLQQLAASLQPLAAGPGEPSRPATPFVAEPDSPTGAAATPKRLSDSQVQSFIENGFLSIPVTELSQEWHARYAARASEWTFQGLHEPQVGRHSTHLPETTELCRSATVTGALSSLLGEDYVLYPNRMLQAYGPPGRELAKPTGDQTWHKD
eukprot:COSAG06_NODE_22554_length_719_cov_4.435484_1_plen_162_part_10